MALRVSSGTAVPLPPPHGHATLVTDRLLDVPYHPQSQTNWCWAACAEMIFDYFDTSSETQCQMASEAFLPNQCCFSPGSIKCNRPYYPAEVFDRLAFSYRFVDSALAFSEVSEQIRDGSPIEILWVWDAGTHVSGHLILITGIYASGTAGPGDLEIKNPLDSGAQGRFAYDEVMDAEGLGRWAQSYVDLNQ